MISDAIIILAILTSGQVDGSSSFGRFVSLASPADATNSQKHNQDRMESDASSKPQNNLHDAGFKRRPCMLLQHVRGDTWHADIFNNGTYQEFQTLKQCAIPTTGSVFYMCGANYCCSQPNSNRFKRHHQDGSGKFGDHQQVPEPTCVWQCLPGICCIPNPLHWRGFCCGLADYNGHGGTDQQQPPHGLLERSDINQDVSTASGQGINKSSAAEENWTAPPAAVTASYIGEHEHNPANVIIRQNIAGCDRFSALDLMIVGYMIAVTMALTCYKASPTSLGVESRRLHRRGRRLSGGSDGEDPLEAMIVRERSVGTMTDVT